MSPSQPGCSCTGNCSAALNLAEQELAKLRQRLLHDHLTGLPNRSYLVQNLASLADPATATAGIGVMFADLDGFGAVNSSVGHERANDLLIEVARRIRAAVPDNGFVARLGGDEFVIVVPNAGGDHDVRDLAIEIWRAVTAQPYPVGGDLLHIGISIGFVHAQLPLDEGAHAMSLVDQAGRAMYFAKSHGLIPAGLARVVRYSALEWQVEVQARDRRRHLREAVENGDIQVVYQPIVRLPGGRPIGVEALTRLTDPSGQPLDLDIAQLEDMGVDGIVFRRVLEDGCQTLAAWQRLSGTADFYLSVNLSLSMLVAGDLLEYIESVLATTGIVPSQLVLEVSERWELTDEMCDWLKDLADKGFSLAADDFGIDYSNLARLHQLPFTRLKIDKSFVSEIGGTNPRNKPIIKHLIRLARQLELLVIAEGVETRHQAWALRYWRCHAAQGYRYSQPLTADELTSRLKRQFLVRLRRLTHYGTVRTN